MERGDMEEQRRRLDEQLQQGPDKWVHHVADLARSEEVRTQEFDRPIALRARIEGVRAVPGLPQLPHGIFELNERVLTARAPYAQSPLSYLNAVGDSWNLSAEANRLEWAEFTGPGRRGGVIYFWLYDVTVGTTGLVTIKVTASAGGPGDTGNLEVRSSDALPRLFPVSGFADHTLDLIVHPSLAFGVLVILEPKYDLGYLAFREITYSTLWA
jgi:hypothetical protein